MTLLLKVHPEIRKGSPRARVLNESGIGKIGVLPQYGFTGNKSSYLRNSAKTKAAIDHNHNIGSRMRAFDWCQNQRPWMTLNGHHTSIAQNMRLSTEPTTKI